MTSMPSWAPVAAQGAMTREWTSPSSSALLLTAMKELELVEVDGLSAGAAAAGPAAQDGL
jgi:hypothetical protein